MIVNRDPGDENMARKEPVAVNSKRQRLSQAELPPAAASQTAIGEQRTEMVTQGGSLATDPLG
jgi:hypothetical protein